MKFINELVSRLEKRNIYMKPCTKSQMEKLISIAKGGNLPQSYIEFMSKMGNGGEFMRGESCFMNEIEYLKEGAFETLEENESKKILTDEDFVFWMSQGCMFCFFNLNQ